MCLSHQCLPGYSAVVYVQQGMRLEDYSQEKLDEAPADSGLDDLLDLVVGAIREVGQRPAGICEHLLIIGVNQPGQRGERKLCLHTHTHHSASVHSRRLHVKCHVRAVGLLELQERCEARAACLGKPSSHEVLTCSKGGGGCFPRQKLDSVQVALRSMDSLVLSLSCSRRGARAPLSSTRSLHWAESPAMLPRAHTACGQTAKPWYL